MEKQRINLIQLTVVSQKKPGTLPPCGVKLMSSRGSHRFVSVPLLPVWRPRSKDEELRQGFEFRTFDSFVLCRGSLLQHCSLDPASREKA